MTDRDKIPAEDAPELFNDEQEDEAAQAQSMASDARYNDAEGSPLDSVKPEYDGDLDDDDSTQDLIDKMRDMEQSGRIDMGAYRGEPNMDDEDETYGAGHDDDEL